MVRQVFNVSYDLGGDILCINCGRRRDLFSPRPLPSLVAVDVVAVVVVVAVVRGQRKTFGHFFERDVLPGPVCERERGRKYSALRV